MKTKLLVLFLVFLIPLATATPISSSEGECSQDYNAGVFTNVNCFEYEFKTDGTIKVSNPNAGKSSFIGLGARGFAGSWFTKYVSDYTWTWVYSKSQGVHYFNGTVVNPNFNWYANITFNNNGEMKFAYGLQNKLGSDVTNLKLFYLQTVEEGTLLTYDDFEYEVGWSSYKLITNNTKNLTAIVPEIVFPYYYAFDYTDLINDGFIVTDFFAGNANSFDSNLPNKLVVVVAVTKNNGVLPDGALRWADPAIADTTGTSFLLKPNQRKMLVNPQDDSWWISFVGNNSCYLGFSADNGSNWNYTNVSAGDALDQYCSLEIDEYGNVWGYWTNNSDYLLGRTLGWNGSGWDIGSAFTITEQDNAYGADFSMRYCGDSMGVLYTQGAGGSAACFKACRNIADGGCNQTTTNWNSTNQTTNSYCSLLPTAWAEVSEQSLDCVSNDFVGVAGANNAGDFSTHLLYGTTDGAGNWVWNTGELFTEIGATYSSSIFHNSTTIFAASPERVGSIYNINYRECPIATNCNETSNWTTAIALDDSATSVGVYGTSLGLVNNTAPVCLWEQTNNVYGRSFNATSGEWNNIVKLVDTAATLRQPNLVRNYTASNTLPFIFSNDTSNEVWLDEFNTNETVIRIRAYDEQNGNQIFFNADVYNTTALNEYLNTFEIRDATSTFPQNDVRIDVTNTSYYSRSRLLWVTPASSEDIRVYLINATAADVIAVRFHIRTIFSIGIGNATVAVTRNINGSIQTVGELKSDFNGDALFYLEVGAPYFVTVTHSDYNSFFGQVNPSDNDYTIYLSVPGTEAGNFTGFQPSILDDVYWWFYPFENFITENTNLTFFVNATNNNLTYFGMNVSNSTNSSIYFINQSSTSGGTVYYYLNLTNCSCIGNVSVRLWFGRNPEANMFRWMPIDNSTYSIVGGVVGTLVGAKETLDESGMSQIGRAVLVLFFAVLIGAFVCRINLMGGLIVTTILMGFFAIGGTFDIVLGGETVWRGVFIFFIAFATAVSGLYLQGRFR